LLRSDRKLPENIPNLVFASSGQTIIDLVATARPDLTRSAVRRLIGEGGVRLNGEQQQDPQAQPETSTGDILQTGRRRWHRLKIGHSL
jgi:tyrosyl-tRNA synthetase